MKPSDKLLTFEPGINRVIREASKRREYPADTARQRPRQAGARGDGDRALRLARRLRCTDRRPARPSQDQDRRPQDDISTVRERWRATLVRIEAGGDPLEKSRPSAKSTQREQMTFAKLVDDYLLAKEKAKRRWVRTRPAASLRRMPCRSWKQASIRGHGARCRAHLRAGHRHEALRPQRGLATSRSMASSPGAWAWPDGARQASPKMSRQDAERPHHRRHGPAS